jgi:hypothetical protein
MYNQLLYIYIYIFFFFFAMLRIKSRASCTLGKCSNEKQGKEPGVVMHICNSRTQEAKGGGL